MSPPASSESDAGRERTSKSERVCMYVRVCEGFFSSPRTAASAHTGHHQLLERKKHLKKERKNIKSNKERTYVKVRGVFFFFPKAVKRDRTVGLKIKAGVCRSSRLY